MRSFKKILLLYISLIFLACSCYAQYPNQHYSARNTIHSLYLSYNSLTLALNNTYGTTVNYEYNIYGKYNYGFRFGIGVIQRDRIATSSYDLGSLLIAGGYYLFSTPKHHSHLELNMYLSRYQSNARGNNESYFQSIIQQLTSGLAYRWQKPEGGFLFRVGVSFGIYRYESTENREESIFQRGNLLDLSIGWAFKGQSKPYPSEKK